jgi:hypothetical protein
MAIMWLDAIPSPLLENDDLHIVTGQNIVVPVCETHRWLLPNGRVDDKGIAPLRCNNLTFMRECRHAVINDLVCR